MSKFVKQTIDWIPDFLPTNKTQRIVGRTPVGIWIDEMVVDGKPAEAFFKEWMEPIQGSTPGKSRIFPIQLKKKCFQ